MGAPRERKPNGGGNRHAPAGGRSRKCHIGRGVKHDEHRPQQGWVDARLRGRGGPNTSCSVKVAVFYCIYCIGYYSSSRDAGQRRGGWTSRPSEEEPHC